MQYYPQSHNHCCNRAKDTFNMDVHFIAPNPVTSFNRCSIYPNVDPSAYVGSFSTIIGDVTIRENVFIAPNVSVRADEGFPIFIDRNTNLQDGVILHGLVHGRVENNNNEYSIYIGQNVSCAHGALIHGPCKIENNVFIGFHVTILDAIIGDGCFLSINAVVSGGIEVPPNRFVPVGAVIDTQEKADQLRYVTPEEAAFAQEVQYVNYQFPAAYAEMFGSTNNSCSLKCR